MKASDINFTYTYHGHMMLYKGKPKKDTLKDTVQLIDSKIDRILKQVEN